MEDIEFGLHLGAPTALTYLAAESPSFSVVAALSSEGA
jgi:hypothetical protein